MKLVSIIIPVYNGEKHIENCLYKLMKQTYEEIEIIVINDGSTDSKEYLKKEFFKKNKKIKVINKENTGVSDTRNLGIKMAKGEYILFLDSDDFLENYAIEKMIDNISDKNIDMLIFGFKVLGSKNRPNDTKILKKIADSNNIKDDLISSIISTKNNILGYVWRAMYSKKLLISNNISFMKGVKISEDFMFLLDAVYKSNKIAIDDTEYYLYNINEQSMSIKYIPTLLEDMMLVNKWMYDMIVKNNTSLIDGYYCCMCNTYLRFVQNVVRNNNLSTKERIILIKKEKKEYKFKQYIKKVWYKYDRFNLKTLISLIMFRFDMDNIYVVLFTFKEKRRKNEKSRYNNNY